MRHRCLLSERMVAPTHLRRAFAGKRVLITGGLGFIGSNLARALVRLGARVSIVDSLIPEYGGNRRNLAGVAGRVRVHVADVRDWSRLPQLVRGQDFLFNLAGQTSHMDSMSDPQTDLDINCARPLISRSVCGSLIESMWLVWPARLKRKSCPRTSCGSRDQSRTSATCTRTRPATPARLRRLPPYSGMRLSTMLTRAPRRTSARARLDPMKPRPPVMSTRLPAKARRR